MVIRLADKTYKDQQGNSKRNLDEGSYVNTGDNWWQMGATGGAKVNHNLVLLKQLIITGGEIDYYLKMLRMESELPTGQRQR